MPATAVQSRPSVKPVVGRLVRIMSPKLQTPLYAVLGKLQEPASIDGKVGYVVRAAASYTQIHDIHGSTYTLDNGLTKYHRVSKAEKVAWASEAAKTMRSYPFGTGKYYYHGNDPELFFVDGKGVVVPAFAFLPSKAEAVEEEAWPGIKDYGGRGSERIVRKMFWDGFQAEFTGPPSTCFGWAADYLQDAIKNLCKKASGVCKEAKPTWKPVVDVPEEMLKNSPRECVELGCDPSMNAYFEGPNPALMQLDAQNLPFRFAGYHIHFGIGKKEPETYARIVKMLDAIAGVASVCLFRGMEDPRRRKYYGLAGEYRLPPHGLEWRTLSSCVLCSPYTFHLMSDLARGACQMRLHKLSHFWKWNEKEVIRAINDLDVDLAWKILQDNKDSLQLLLKSVYPASTGNKTGPEKAMILLEKGALKTLDTDMLSSWKIYGTWRTHSDDNKATIYGLQL